MADLATEAILSFFFLFNYYVVFPIFHWWRNSALIYVFRRR